MNTFLVISMIETALLAWFFFLWAIPKFSKCTSRRARMDRNRIALAKYFDSVTKGSNYYYINSKGKVKEKKWEDSHNDFSRLNYGNIFISRQEAHTVKKILIETLKNCH